MIGDKYKYVTSDIIEYDGPDVEGPKVTGTATETAEGVVITYSVNTYANKYWVYRVVNGEKVLLKATTATTVTVPADDSSDEYAVCARIKNADGAYDYITSDVLVAVQQ